MLNYLAHGSHKKLKRFLIVNQWVCVDATNVLTRVDGILNSTEIWTDVEAMLNTAYGVWESTTCKDQTRAINHMDQVFIGC